MLFNSLGFFLFLPAVLAVFAALPTRHRWLLLLAASYAFYAATGPVNLIYLGAVTLVVYGCGLGIGRSSRRSGRVAFLVLGLGAVLGALVAFKFYDFAAGEIERLIAWAFETEAAGALPRLGVANPVGFSFYAFMAASYLIDVFVRRLAVERHPGRLALYVAFFPKILAGPIERATTFLPQIVAGLRSDPERFVTGLQLIGWGLVKKVVIADNLAPLVDRTFKIAAYASPIDLLFSVYFFAFQIYCDFSGYADIAIGVALLFGIQLMDNFRRPYLSKSTAEFWAERWHISLGRWFRDYLYIPLGGSRAGALRRYLNIMLVFVVSGLWHAGLGYGVGWTFLVWGALNGFYQWVGLATRSLWKSLADRLPRLATSLSLHVVRVLLTFHLILISWVFFRAESVDQAIVILKKIWAGLPDMPGLIGKYPFTVEHYLGLGLIVALIGIEILDERRPIWQRLAAMPVAFRWTAYYAGIFALLLAGRWQAQEFIYMQF
jgi:D-alanyl-lipoteichoic acid acyltransferase DltB (MBOAT superfamily)